MVVVPPPIWKNINSVEEFERIVELSKEKPTMLFRYDSQLEDHKEAKSKLEKEWSTENTIETYLLDSSANRNLSREISKLLGLKHYDLQVILLADGTTMYDETNELISYKKIQIALRIIKRTFKWMYDRESNLPPPTS